MRQLPKITQHERYLIRHALGFGHGIRFAFRNYFNTDGSGADFEDWQSLVDRGLAIRWIAHGCPGFVFAASEAAARAAKEKTEGFDEDVMRHFRRVEGRLKRSEVAA